MKYLTFVLILPVALLVTSCNKSNGDENKDLAGEVAGTYKGTLTDNGLKDAIDATADIIKIDEKTVEIHCYSSVLDTTFVMELFENGDSTMLCNIGDDFKNMYGHERMKDHHMMGDPNWQNWTHHMDEEHDQGDEHYGGFNKVDHSFTYKFVMDTALTLQFNGKRQ
ncbi:MAG: hypothetical protein GXO86_06675 [Chlorobi bacterium]|nr:hypothetical protein [Chlorobiota bacterium]